MRAFAIDQHGSLDQLKLRDVADPRVGPGEIRVRIKASAVNPGDWKVLTGREGGRFLHAASFPIILGFDFSGIVDQVGSGVGTLRAGDAVFGFLPYSPKNRQGTMAEYVSVPASSVAKKPEEVPFVHAACAATTASTALQALRDKGELKFGERVLINGASGGVGSYAVQVAKLMGAEVWGTCSGAKSDFVREELGADRVVDYQTTPISQINEKFDVVFDAASASSFKECERIMSPNGRYVTLLPSLGFVTGLVRALFSDKACRMLAVTSRTETLEQLATWMADGRLHHAIDSTYPLEELPQALERLRSRELKGKVGVTVEG